MDSSTDQLFAALIELRGELADHAYTLECRGRRDAADVASAITQRLTEICDRFEEKAAAIAANTGLSDHPSHL